LDDIESDVLFERLLIEKATLSLLADVEVTPEETKDYYELNKKDFLRAEMVKVSQILLETENKAIEVLDKVKDSTTDIFRKTAQEESKGIEASKGGEMGVFELGQLPLAMEKVIFSLQAGETSQVVESSYGYHIFRLDEKFGPELISEEKAALEIEVKILDQKIKESIDQYVENLKSKFEWHFYQENLSFPYQRINHE
jgi:parvulin-like peptidyl-prolyl isomerase